MNTVIPTRSPADSHFERIGGAPVVARLVARFYAEMDTLPEARGIRAMHPQDLGPITDVLTRYLGEWLGGPPLYSRERGHPRLRARHMPFLIGEAERDAWMLCMERALNAEIENPVMRESIYKALWQLGDFMRNKPPQGEQPASMNGGHG